MFVASLLIFILGLAAFSIRLVPKFRVRLQDRQRRRMVARRLRTVVLRQNLRQGIAALREKRENANQPVESRMAASDDLYRRIEKIRVRSISYRNGRKRTPRRGWAGDRAYQPVVQVPSDALF